MLFETNTLLLISIVIILIGLLITCTIKQKSFDTDKLFFGLLIIIFGFTLMSMTFAKAYIDSKINETKREIFQMINEQKYNDEVDYSIMEINEFSDTIYQQCSIE